MTLLSNSKLIRWAYLPERIMHEHRSTVQTNLCNLFWRSAFLVPTFLIVFSVLAIATIWVWLPIVLVCKVKMIGDFYDRRVCMLCEKKKNSVVWAYLKSLKEKTCSIVHIID
jgi:hypothetical protein